MKQFTPKKVVIYGEDKDRVEIKLNNSGQVRFIYDNDPLYWDCEPICIDPKLNIEINRIYQSDTTYYVKRAGKRYRKNRRGYR